MEELQNFFRNRDITVTTMKKYEKEKFIVIYVDKILLPYLNELSSFYGDDYIAVYPAGNEIEIIIDL